MEILKDTMCLMGLMFIVPATLTIGYIVAEPVLYKLCKAKGII